MKRSRALAAAVAALALGLAACASVIGLESVSYVDGAPDGGDANAAETSPPADASDACTGTTCGPRCCRKGAVCMDGGGCSNDVVDVSAGGYGSCALVADGTVWCWGDNSLGQIGVGDAGDGLCQFIAAHGTYHGNAPCRVMATKVQGLPPARQVSAGAQTACAVEANGAAVWCWGRNDLGALGHDPAADPLCADLADPVFDDGGGATIASVPCNAIPQQVPGIPGPVAEVAVGEHSACARNAAGDVFCWGGGMNGELGALDAGSSSASAVQVEGLPHDIVQVGLAIFASGACAVSDGGQGWCWGSKIFGEPPSPTAHAVTGGDAAPPPTDLAEIHVGGAHVCARRRNGTIVCWGHNEDSQLGRGSCDDNGIHPADTTVIGLPDDQVAIDSRWFHACALDTVGKVRCWGVAQDGAMGLGTVKGDTATCSGLSSNPTPTVVPGLPRITRIATGVETTFAVAEDGTLWAWGANDYSRLGHPERALEDFTSCGDPGNQTVCNPTPKLVGGLP